MSILKIKKDPLLIFLILFFSSCTPSKKLLLDKKIQKNFDRPYIRVLLLRSEEKVKIFSLSKIKISEKESRKIIYDLVRGDFIIYPGEIKEPVLIESWDSPLEIDGKPYRGTIELYNVMNKLVVVNVVKLSDYLQSVVPSEIPVSWPEEVLKVQAVATRTYAYYHLLKNNNKNLYDLDATTNFQVYKGLVAESARTSKAIEQTEGEIMLYQNKPILAYFHSTCGGGTTDDKSVWQGDDLPYLVPKRCNYCKNSPHYSWETILTRDEMEKYLSQKYKKMGRIENVSFEQEERRVVQVKIKHDYGTIKMTGNEFRLLFPFKKIKSTYFNSRQAGDQLILTGHGWGHGVGMCQWGAKGMAEYGRDYKSILKYYYQGIKIAKFRKKLHP